MLSFAVGLLDGFGLAMFLPLLQLVTGDSTSNNGEGMGGMNFLLDAFNKLGITLTLQSVLLIITLFFTLKGVAVFIRQYYGVVVRMYFIKKLRFQNIDGLVNYRYKSFVMADAGRIQNTLSGEVGRVNQAYNAYFSMLQAIMMMFVYMGLAFFTNPQFAVLVVIGGLLSNLAYRQIFKRTKALSAQITTGGHHFQSQLIQFVGHFKYLKSTALLGTYSRKLKESVVFIEESNKRIGYYNSLLLASREPLNIAVVSLVILAQTLLFSSSLNGIVLALLFFYRALTYVMNFQTAWNNFLNVSGALANMTDFNRELKVSVENYGPVYKENFDGEFRLESISFCYGKTPILENISMHIPANSCVALVGESGSGKTTLINLICGLFRPIKGEVYIDGINYSELDIRCLQKQIGYISQDPVIFSESIYDNVTLWSEQNELNLKRFWETCEQASIGEFIRTLPEGMNTPLGNNGIQLSGGQKQRISIARELFKDVSVLIMDEATSALDSTLEREIQMNIDLLKGKYTIIIVAHRLSTVQNADRIYLMNNGSIEDFGSFDELKAQNDRFKEMVKLQEI